MTVTDAHTAAGRLMEWHEVGRWLDYAAVEFVTDMTTRAYLEHVAGCVRDEGERRYAQAAGLEPSVTHAV